MSDLKPRGIPFCFDGTERHFLFTLNAIDALQEKYGKSVFEIIEGIVKDEVPSKTLREILKILLNDEAARAAAKGKEIPEVTDQDVGEMIGMDNYWEVVGVLMQAYGISMPQADEDEFPNQMGGEQK